MSAELLAPVHNRHAGGNRLQLVGPIHCRITASGDQHPLAAERLQLLYSIMKVRYLIAVCSLNLQLRHLENTIPYGQNDCARPVPLTGRRCQNIRAVLLPLLGNNLLAQYDSRIKGPGLLSQLINQIAAKDRCDSPYIPDHFLGIDKHSSAQLFLSFNQFGFEVPHAAIKGCIHTGRTPANNRHIV
ncbi:hypothetical protein D3C75_745640 [compost metagenome]